MEPSEGPMLGPFRSRSEALEALEAEREWLMRSRNDQGNPAAAK